MRLQVRWAENVVDNELLGERARVVHFAIALCLLKYIEMMCVIMPYHIGYCFVLFEVQSGASTAFSML